MAGDWTLTYPGVELSFGSRESGMGFDTAPAVGLPDDLLGDVSIPAGDGRLFGVDLIGGQTVTFEVDLFAADRDAVRALLAQMRRAWRGDAVRLTAGQVATLRSESGRVTFGRPRRFAANSDDDHYGLSRATADFATATDLWFGDQESATVGLVPAPGGGLIAPLSAPLATTESSDRSQVIEISGELPTPLSVTIEGPITNPTVEVVGVVRWELRTTLAYDQSLTIDAAPWARTVLRDGAPVPGTLTPRSTRLAKALVPPGQHELVLRGASETGTARAVASWRPAFHTP